MRKWISLLLCALLLPPTLPAQTPEGDFLDNIGKIYVVVAVIGILFLGIVTFLVYLERKLTNLENQINHKHGTEI